MKRIFANLEKQITPEDLAWLKRVHPVLWQTYPDNVSKEKDKYTCWKIGRMFNRFAISVLIQTIIDAKMRQYPREQRDKDKSREKLDLQYANGLPKKYLMELAEILGIEGYQCAHTYYDCTPNGVELAKIIMNDIGE